jgi:hypothetical protein
VSGSVIQGELTRMDLKLKFTDGLPRTLLDSDPSIDDPVNDTGLAPHGGDLQMSDEFACLLRMILKESGEFS